MEKQRVIFVINPIAGGEDKTSFLEKLPDYASEFTFDYEVLQTTGNGDEQALMQLIKHFSPDKILAVGGDGTLMMAAAQIMRTDITLGIIPFGSANGMAVELQIPNEKDDAMKVAFMGAMQYIDNIKIDGKHNCIHIGDIGFNARLVKRFEEEKQRGLWGYVRQFFREFRFRRRIKFYIKADGERYVTKAHMIAFANARRYGTGALLNPIGKLDDGKFELCIIKNISIKTLLIALFTFSTGALYRTKYAKIIQCKEARIRLKKRQRFALQADGEVLGDTHDFSLKIEPQALKVMTPTDEQLGFFHQLLKEFQV